MTDYKWLRQKLGTKDRRHGNSQQNKTDHPEITQGTIGHGLFNSGLSKRSTSFGEETLPDPNLKSRDSDVSDSFAFRSSRKISNEEQLIYPTKRMNNSASKTEYKPSTVTNRQTRSATWIQAEVGGTL